MTENGDDLVRDQYYQTVTHTLNDDGELVNEEANSTGSTNGFYITCSKTDSEVTYVDLYPVFDEARWLYFDTGLSGNGATYVGAAYRLTNDTRTTDADFYYFDNTFFTKHISRRSGYSLEGWYLFANQDAETGEITNLEDAEDVTFKYIDGNGDVQTTTINTTAIKVADTDGDIQAIGTWYVTSDGKITNTVADGNSKLFEVDSSSYLRFYKALNGMTLYANWEPVNDTEYTVIIWKESMTDTYADNAVSDNRNFDYVQSYKFVGQSNTTAAAVKQPVWSNRGELA